MKERFPLPDLLPVVEEEREREGRERERRERRVPTREELGLPKDAFVYVSFNRVMKVFFFFLSFFFFSNFVCKIKSFNQFKQITLN